MTWIDWLIIGFYFCGLLTIGVVFARVNKTSSDMFVALGAWTVNAGSSTRRR